MEKDSEFEHLERLDRQILIEHLTFLMSANEADFLEPICGEKEQTA